MKLSRKIICLALVLSLSVWGMGCMREQSDGTGYLFNYTMMENPQNLDPQIATDSNSITIINSIFTGLMTKNANGDLIYGVAESYSVSSDGLRYVFNLRQDYKWYSVEGFNFDVTAYDFLFAFQRIFNPATYSPYGEKLSCLKNASYILDGNEEYSYTDIGVYASDKYTITFLLDYPNPDFLNLLAESFSMPCNETFFNNTHAMYGLYDTTTISNGAFYIKQWFYDKYGNQNFMTLRKNPLNPQTDDYSPYALEITIDENTNLNEVEHAFYKNETDLYYSNSTIDKSSIGKNDNLTSYDIATVGLVFNLDDEYFYNKNLRYAFKYSIDRNKALKNTSSDIDITYSIVPSGCMVDSTSYRNLVDEKTFSTINFNENTALSEFQIALEDLGEIPTIRLIMESGTVDTSYLKSIINEWENLFDVTIIIDQLLPEDFQQALKDKDYQMAIYTLKSQDGEPYSFLEPFLSINEFSGYESLEVDTILNSSNVALSTDDKINLYAQAEKQILDDTVFVPLYNQKYYLVCAEGIENIGYNPFTNILNFNYALNYNQE